jgi:hypothetical protein
MTVKPSVSYYASSVLEGAALEAVVGGTLRSSWIFAFFVFFVFSWIFRAFVDLRVFADLRVPQI